MNRHLILAATCLAAACAQAQPLQPDQLRLRVTMQLAADLGVPANSTFNPRFFDGSDYVNQINPGAMGFGRYRSGCPTASVLVNNTNALEHRMVAPFRGALRSTYMLGSSSGAASTTTFSRYRYDGSNRVDVATPDLQTAEGFDWVDDNTIIYTVYNPSTDRNRLYLADVVAQPFAVNRNTTWNGDGYITTSVSTRIRNVRVGDVYSGYAYYGDAGQTNHPAFYALDLATGTETLLGNLGALTFTGSSHGLWTVVERGGYLYVQTTDNGIFVYQMAGATTLGPLYATYTAADLAAVTGYAGQHWGLDVTPDGTRLLLGAAQGKAFELGTPIQPPAPLADYVIHISVDALRPDAITTLGSANLPNFYRMRTQGAFTDNARSDYDYTLTLPDHTTELTGRGVMGASGHGWNSNLDPLPGQTLASNKGSYVAGVFDVAHDNGLRTGAYAGKSKFSLFDTSWNAGNGAPDNTGPNNGTDKIDTYLYSDNTAALVNALATNMTSRPFNYAFIHFRDPDTIGESLGFMGTDYLNTVKAMDNLLGSLFSLADTNAQLHGRTAVLLVADHGGYDKTHADATRREAYTVPFYVWAPGVLPGADLYALNPASRQEPGTNRPPYTAPVQPIRNGEAANVALQLLGLGPVTGSTLNYVQDLALTLMPPTDFQLAAAGDAGIVSFTLVPNARHDLQRCDDLTSGSWSDVVADIAGPGGVRTNINVGPVSAPHRFYRLKLHL